MDNSNTVGKPSWRNLPFRRRITIFAVVFFGILIAAYFYLSSTAFVRSFVVPKVKAETGADLAVGDTAISPFSQVLLRKITFTPAGEEPLFKAEEIRVRYKLSELIKGNLALEEGTIQSPQLNLVQKPDGTSNLGAFLKALDEKQKHKVSTKSGSPKQPSINLHNIAIKQGSVNYVRKEKNGAVMSSKINNLDVSLASLQVGQSASVPISFEMKVDQQPGKNETNTVASSILAKVNGKIDFDLSKALFPSNIKGNVTLDVPQAGGAYQELAQLKGVLDLDVRPESIGKFDVKFSRAGQELGTINISGPLELATMEGRVKVDVRNIDRRVLNLSGAAMGLDFGNTRLNSTNVLDFLRKGKGFVAVGRVTASDATVRNATGQTPAMDVDLDYHVSANLEDKMGVLHKFELIAKHNGTETVHANIDRPMNLNWGREDSGVRESSIHAVIRNFDVQDWRAFIPASTKSGSLSGDLTLLVQQDGRLMKLNGSAGIDRLNVMVSSNELKNANVSLAVTGKVERFNFATLDAIRYRLTENGTELFSGTAGGTVNLANQDVSFQTSALMPIPAILKRFPVDGLTAQSGTVKANAIYNRNGGVTNTSWSMVLDEFTGRYKDYVLDRWTANMTAEANLKAREWDISRGSLNLKKGTDAIGSIDISARYDLDQKVGKATLSVAGVNEQTLTPFLQKSLGKAKLISSTVNGSVDARYDAKGESSISGNLKLSKFVISKSAAAVPADPIELGLQWDGTMKGALMNLKRSDLVLTPTARVATNSLQITGKLDLSASNASPSQLTVRADALDFSSYYDAFSDDNPARKTPKPTVAPKTAVNSETEPDPIALPVKQMTADVKIGRAFLNDMAMTNFIAKATLSAGTLSADPMQFNLNGGNVSARANIKLDVPGYVYDFEFNADNIPVGPMANSFSPTYKDQAKGNLFASAKLHGAGTTDPNLRKSLDGNFHLNFTNASIQVVGPKLKAILTPIAIVVGVQDLLRSPLNYIHVDANVGKAQVDLQKVVVHSDAFLAESKGVIPLSEVLTNSPVDLPVDFSIPAGLAKHFTLAHLSPNGNYMKFPSFVKVGGTVGNPSTKVNKVVITGLLATGVAGTVGGTAGGVLKEFGGILSGNNPNEKKTNTTDKPQPEDPNKNDPKKKINPLDILRNLQKKE